MRQPTPDDAAYAHWQSALAGQRMPVHEDEPQSGFYRMRLVKGGPFVPVAIWIDKQVDEVTGELTDDERLVALANGKTADPTRVWSFCARHPITEEDYRDFIEVQEWASHHSPDHPAANPYRPLNLLDMEPVV